MLNGTQHLCSDSYSWNFSRNYIGICAQEHVDDENNKAPVTGRNWEKNTNRVLSKKLTGQRF